MHKLFRATHLCLSQNLTKSHFNTTAKTFSPFHHFHGLTETSKLRTLSKEVNLLPESESSQARSLKISHPWPEWVELMDHLMTRGYFSGDENPFRSYDLGRHEASLIWKAGLRFSRDRFDIIKFLSKANISVIAACGCPTLDRNVVSSGKRLRIHANVNEGDTCSSCYFKEDCERAYMIEIEEVGCRTVDVMRILLLHGLNSITRAVKNKPSLKKIVTKSVRILLREIVACIKRSAESNLPKSERLVMIAPAKDHSCSLEIRHTNAVLNDEDWLCPRCNLINFSEKIKCFRCDSFSEKKLRQINKDCENLPLKKGDWKCDNCMFLNSARYIKCVMCEELHKRKLKPWEWECHTCNYINITRPVTVKVCFNCDTRRPKWYLFRKSIESQQQFDLENGRSD